MSSKLPPSTHVQAGERISARLINAIIAALGSSLWLKVGRGLRITRTEQGMVLDLADRFPDEYIRCRITAVSGQSPGRADSIRYSVEGIGRPEVSMTDAEPYWGRPARQGHVLLYAAEVGTLCFIVLDQTDDGRKVGRLWIPQGGPGGETLFFRSCGQSLIDPSLPGLRGGNGIVPPVPPPPPPPPAPSPPSLEIPPISGA